MDRRALAVTLFSQVPLPRHGKSARVPSALSLQCATWAAMRAHALACSESCPLQVLANEVIAGSRREELVYRITAGLLPCNSVPTLDPRDAPGLAHYAHIHAYEAICRILTGHFIASAKYAREDAAREAARAETLVRGLSGGVEHCVELALRLRLVG